jgi:hypothetical protein
LKLQVFQSKNQQMVNQLQLQKKSTE